VHTDEYNTFIHLGFHSSRGRGGADQKWMNFGTYIHFEAMAALEPRKEYQHLGYGATAIVKSGATVDENRTDGSTVVLGMRLIDLH
jgi:hypothetical protein